jgi:hypothetical protein
MCSARRDWGRAPEREGGSKGKIARRGGSWPFLCHTANVRSVDIVAAVSLRTCRGKGMGQVPLSVLLVVTAGFVLGGLLTTVSDPSPRWIPILIMGGVAAYLEYHVRSRDQR